MLLAYRENPSFFAVGQRVAKLPIAAVLRSRTI
jgi:pyruvate/2-oxoglutarate dehydrogenase complex dihydrolipoamide dehydrogenase (E3) component